MTLQIRKYTERALQQFSEIPDFKIRDSNKISKRAVQDSRELRTPQWSLPSYPALLKVMISILEVRSCYSRYGQTMYFFNNMWTHTLPLSQVEITGYNPEEGELLRKENCPLLSSNLNHMFNLASSLVRGGSKPGRPKYGF